MPFAALSMTGSYAILIDPGAVVGLGCSYDGPPTPGVSSTSQWGFYVYGICNPGHYLAPPAFNYCTDVDECQAAHPRSRRSNGWPPWAFSSTISPTSTYSEATSVYPSATSSPPVPWECQNYMQLTNGNRHVTYDSRNGTLNCDNVITPGWYRFTGAAGTRMPESCADAPEYGCGTHAAGWLNGSHPDVADGALTYRVCYHWVSLCCWQSNYIQVRNCSGFYVYNLIQTGCSYRYCGMHGNESIAQSTSSSVAASCDFDSGLCSGWSQSFNDIFDWTLNSGSTSSSSTGPSSDHSGSGGYMYIEASSPRVNGDNAKLELSVPVSGSAFCLTFYYHMYGANMGTLNVYNGNTLIFTKSGDQGNIWIQATMTLYLQGNVIFEGVVGSSYDSDVAIDDVSITNGSCADYRIRLVNGAGINEGRVEININGTWGTICDDHWDIQDANVVCRMLNYSGALSANFSASFGAGSGRIWLDDVHCQGIESSIVDCPHRGIGSHNCGHSEDAGVVCATQQQQSSTITPTASSSISPTSASSSVPWECQNYMQLTNGNRHVTYDSRSGTLNCDNLITPGWYRFTGAAGTQMPESCADAPENGCGTHAAGWLNGSHPDVADGALTYQVCYHWGSLCCWRSNDIQVRNCSGFYVYNLVQTASCSYRYCGMSGNEGIGQSTSSSASCDFDSGLCSGWSQSFNDIFDWTLNSGSTSSSSTGPSSDHSGSGGYMYIEASSPRVNGDNAKLELSVPVSGSASCLTFYYHMYGANMGTLNVYNGNTLIFTKSGDQGNIWIEATMTLYLQGNVIFEGVVGSSYDSDIAIDDMSITNGSCADYSIRLVNGAAINEGRVEININGTWGTICDDYWDIQDANVVCRMLNYSGALSANFSASFGAGSGRIWLDNVHCQGYESSIVDCPHRGIGIHNCGHGEDAGVVCATQQQQSSTITPVPTTSSSFSPPSSSSSSDPNNFHLTGWSGGFSSPNHPYYYENRHYCTWLITVTTGYYVHLNFSYFDLEHGGSYCPYDYVEIFDGNSTSAPRIIKRCGNHAPWCVQSSSNVLFVRFLTDGSVVRYGFFAHYETVYSRSGICHSATAATTYVTPMTSSEHGIHPTPSSSFYASSSINVQPPAEDFVLHLPADCAQMCSNTPGSFVCSCYNGFQLGSDGKTCLDINECRINNGGCSHHCINVPGSFYCDCPEGVTMAADNRSCVEPGVAVTCSDTSMTVSMEQRSFPFISIGNLNLRDPLCQAYDNGTHFILTTPLNGCGTTHNESQDALFFWNAVVANAVNIGNRGITRTHNFRLPFYCQYSRQKMLSLSFTPLNNVPHTEPGYGDLTFKLELYRSSSFSVPYNQNEFPIVKNLGENLYMMISVESSASLTVMAINMTATKDLSPDSSPQYPIIENGCSLDSAMDFQYNATSNLQQFILPAFRFLDDYDTVYIHVGAVACHAGSANSRCAQSCPINGGRKRRAALQDEKKESTDKVWISGGPLIIKDVSKESGDSGQSSGQAALIGGVGAAGGLFVLAVVALVVLAVKYRIARLFMNRNKVGDLYTSQDENMSRRNAYVEPEDMMEKEDVL